MLVRRAGDMHGGIGLQRTFVLRLATRPVSVECGVDGVATDSQVVQAEARARLNVGNLAERGCLSWEPTDVTSRLYAQIMSRSTKLSKSLWSYVLSSAGDPGMVLGLDEPPRRHAVHILPATVLSASLSSSSNQLPFWLK